MELMTNYQSIFNSADKGVLERARNYFKSGAVGAIDASGSVLFANVRGSRMKPYRVQIKLDENKQPIAAWCSCPYNNGMGSFCKHTYAVLLKHFAEIPNDGAKKIGPVIKGKTYFKEAKMIELSSITTDSRLANQLIGELNRQIVPVVGAVPMGGKRYKVAFVIERGRSVYSAYGEKAMIVPMAQYLKLNGEQGRLEKMRGGIITESMTREERLLLSRTFLGGRHDGYRDWYQLTPIGLFSAVDFLLQNALPNVFIKSKSRYLQADFKRIAKVEVFFKIKGIKEKGDNVVFGPLISFVSDNGAKIECVDPKDIEFDGLSMLIVTDNAVFCALNDDLIVTFVRELFASANLWKYSEIKYLCDYMQENHPGKITVKFDAERINITHPVPKPFLVLSEKRTWQEVQSFASLLFDYGGREIKGSDRSDFLIINDEEKDLQLAVRQRWYEKSVCDYVNDLRCFSEPKSHHRYYDFDREYGREDSFYFSMPLNDLLTKHGRQIVESGIALRMFGQKEKISWSGNISLKANYHSDWLDLELECKDASGNKSSVRLDDSLVRNGIVYADGKLVIINKENISKLEHFIKCGMSESGKLRVSKYNFHIIDELYGDIENKTDALNELKLLGKRLRGFKEIKKYSLPKRFRGTLRDYQREGYNWLHFLNEYGLNGCLADDMGLGKTVQTLAFFQSLKEENRLALSLVVVPVNVIANWENEINTFAPELNYFVHVGVNRVKDAEHLTKFDLIIVSYQTLKNDIELFNQLEFDYVVLDESQNIKNYNTLSCKAIKTLRSKHRLSLTGTPVENNTLELWSQMDFLIPKLLGDHREFRRNFANPIENLKDQEATLRLKKTVFPFILRRRKEDVANDLPEKSEIMLCTEMDNEQAALYKQYKEFYRQQIVSAIDREGLNKSAIIILAALLKLRQVALFPSLADVKHVNVPSCKFDMLKDSLDEILSEKHKVVVFSQFVEVLKIFKEHFDSQKMSYSYIDGSVSAMKRNEEIKKFQNNDDVRLFLLSLKAGGVGINLTAADYVILFDPWWNPAVEMQAADRVHRIGQTRKVIVYKMITKGTVEEKILELQARKNDLVKNLISAEKGLFKDLSRQDIIHLFE